MRHQPRSVGYAIPADQRASDESLHARLAAAPDRTKQSAKENARLRRKLACALGDRRSARDTIQVAETAEVRP